MAEFAPVQLVVVAVGLATAVPVGEVAVQAVAEPLLPMEDVSQQLQDYPQTRPQMAVLAFVRPAEEPAYVDQQRWDNEVAYVAELRAGWQKEVS